jgi:diazepam-binding inhibitor (GABA receptor modulator, acyl-CoA-binding protein)
MSELETRFHEAADAVQRLARRPDNDTLLRLYALFKQGSTGDVQGKRPGILDPVGRAKFDAWSKLEGTSRESAMQQYVDLVEEVRARG